MAHPVSNIVRFPPARKMKIFILKLFEWEDNWPLPPGGQQEDSRGQSCSAIPWSTNKSLLKTNDLEKTLRSWPLNSVDITHIQPPATDGGREWGDGSGERVGVYKYKYADYSPHLHFSSPAPFLHWLSVPVLIVGCIESSVGKCLNVSRQTKPSAASGCEINRTQRYQRHFPLLSESRGAETNFKWSPLIFLAQAITPESAVYRAINFWILLNIVSSWAAKGYWNYLAKYILCTLFVKFSYPLLPSIHLIQTQNGLENTSTVFQSI